MPQPISYNYASHDQQIADALTFLSLTNPTEHAAILAEFPEWNNHVFAGAWLNTSDMGVDDDWPMWLTDRIEDTGLVYWEEGEPWARTAGDDDES